MTEKTLQQRCEEFVEVLSGGTLIIHPDDLTELRVKAPQVLELPRAVVATEYCAPREIYAFKPKKSFEFHKQADIDWPLRVIDRMIFVPKVTWGVLAR